MSAAGQIKQPKFEALERWLAAKNVSLRELGRRTGIGKQTLSRLLNGRLRNIDTQVALRLEQGTDGAVTAADYVNFFREKC